MGIPEKYEVVNDRGEILGPNETPENAHARTEAQESVWDLVWKRKAISNLTRLVVLYLCIYPLVQIVPSYAEYINPLRPISDLVRVGGSFLPAALAPWVDGYARTPEKFFVAIAILIGLQWWASKLKTSITDKMNSIWIESKHEQGKRSLLPNGLI